jgi:CRP/FNR family cyclic AMP-dependent transcriptional regulator
LSDDDKQVLIKTGEYLIREGEKSNDMYFVKSGCLEVFKRKGAIDGKIGIINIGEIVGEMSFLDNSPRSASVKAMKDTELIRISNEKIYKVTNQQPGWYKALVNTLLDRLRKANARIKV